jgi:hypothetical protein
VSNFSGFNTFIIRSAVLAITVPLGKYIYDNHLQKGEDGKENKKTKPLDANFYFQSWFTSFVFFSIIGFWLNLFLDEKKEDVIDLMKVGEEKLEDKAQKIVDSAVPIGENLAYGAIKKIVDSAGPAGENLAQGAIKKVLEYFDISKDKSTEIVKSAVGWYDYLFSSNQLKKAEAPLPHTDSGNSSQSSLYSLYKFFTSIFNSDTSVKSAEALDVDGALNVPEVVCRPEEDINSTLIGKL